MKAIFPKKNISFVSGRIGRSIFRMLMADENGAAACWFLRHLVKHRGNCHLLNLRGKYVHKQILVEKIPLAHSIGLAFSLLFAVCSVLCVER